MLTIKNTDGKYIIEKEYTKEIKSMIHNGMEYTYLRGKRVTLVEKYRDDERCIVIIEVEAV